MKYLVCESSCEQCLLRGHSRAGLVATVATVAVRRQSREPVLQRSSLASTTQHNALSLSHTHSSHIIGHFIPSNQKYQISSHESSILRRTIF